MSGIRHFSERFLTNVLVQIGTRLKSKLNWSSADIHISEEKMLNWSEVDLYWNNFLQIPYYKKTWFLSFWRNLENPDIVILHYQNFTVNCYDQLWLLETFYRVFPYYACIWKNCVAWNLSKWDWINISTI